MAPEWIAVRLGRLCADPEGRVRRVPMLFDYAARIALIIDLALQGRVTRTLEETDIDTTPTGFAPADALLRHIDEHPDRSMTDAFEHAPVTLLDVLDPDRMSRGRLHKPRSVSLPLALIAEEKARVLAAWRGRPDGETTAEVARLAAALALIVDLEPITLPAPYGPNAWLITDCLTYLEATRERFGLVYATLRVGDAGH
jgi:hypothetical protein